MEKVVGVFVIVCLIVTYGMGMYAYGKFDGVNQMKTVMLQPIVECEKSLPRDKHCILIAIEETK